MVSPASIEPRPRRTILVTGFGAFPGTPRNPTQTVLAALERHRARFERLGIALRMVLLPVRFDSVGRLVAEAARMHRPDAILHLGVAPRRPYVSVETRAVNRAGLHPDASRVRPSQILAPGSVPIAKATYPARRIQAVLRSRGLDSRLSIDAGDYVCNATLYETARAALAKEVGFLHLPRTRYASRPRGSRSVRRPSHEDLVMIVVSTLLTMSRSEIGVSKCLAMIRTIDA